jgi:iron complex transport system substrate-binding protein
MELLLRHRIATLLLGVLSLILVVSCHSMNIFYQTRQTPWLPCRTVQHVVGSSCIPAHPRRVVTLDGLENSLALGIRPIGSAFTPGFPIAPYLQDQLDNVVSVGDFNSPSTERILSLKPDLIITRAEQGVYKHLSYIAPTVTLNVPFPPPSWKVQLAEIAQVLDKEEEYQQLMHDYWQRVEKLKQALGDRRKTMKISIANTSAEYGIWSYGEKHHSGSVLKDIGLQRPKSQQGNFFYIENISKENLLDIDGDALFFVSWGREDDQKTLAKLKQSPLWQSLKVVQQNHVYLVGTHWHGSDIFAINAILGDLETYLVDSFASAYN